jgi:hypothetical protein
MAMRRLQSSLTSVGLVLILQGALWGTESIAGVYALTALLILAVITYHPADARRGAQAVLVLATAGGLFVLGSLLDEVRAGRLQAMSDFLVLIGAAMVVVDVGGRLLDDAEKPHTAPGRSGERHRRVGGMVAPGRPAR